MKYMDLKFFDGDGGSAESVPVSQPTQATETLPAQEPAPTETPDNGGVQDYSVFDKRSPQLFSGARDESEQPEADSGAIQPDATNNVAPPQQEPSQPQAPYRTLKYHGQEVPVATEEDFVRLASQGLDYTRKTQQIAPYRGLISKLEANPALMARVAQMVNTGFDPMYQSQTAQPSSQPQQMEKEPEPQDNETWEEYIKRHKAWEESGRQKQDAQPQIDENAEFMQKFAMATEIQKKQEATVNTARLAMSDPSHPDILHVVSTLPMELQQSMDRDPLVFQLVYDAIRNDMGRGRFFANLGNKNAQQQAVHGNNANGQQNAQQLKSSRPAPYVDGGRGQRAPGSGGNTGNSGLPDNVWDIPSDQFQRLIERARYK